MATEYTVTYAFNGYLRGSTGRPSRASGETVAQLQREGVDIEFCGATQEINGAGQLIAVTARYEAPSKRAVWRSDCRACLPAIGPPQQDEKDVPESVGRHSALVGN